MSPVSNKFNMPKKNNKKIKLKKREKDSQVETLFFKIKNRSFTCMGAQFWLEMSSHAGKTSFLMKIIEKWFQNGTKGCRNACTPTPPNKIKKGILKSNKVTKTIPRDESNNVTKTLLVFFAAKKLRFPSSLSVLFFCVFMTLFASSGSHF